MSTVVLFNLITMVLNVGVAAAIKNYYAALGWFCAVIAVLGWAHP